MAFIGPWEIALIIIVALIFFGPKKLPELAKSMGKAVREYRSATSTFEKLVEDPTKTVAKELTTKKPETSKTQVTHADVEDTLLNTAKKLGIDTKGKTPEQISDEIVSRYKTPTTSKPKPKTPTTSKPKPTKSTK